MHRLRSYAPGWRAGRNDQFDTVRGWESSHIIVRAELVTPANVPEGSAATSAPRVLSCLAGARMKQQDISDQARFYIGVDGGGTNCRARIEDAQGRLLGQGAAGPAATRIGTVELMQAVRTASMAA